MDYDEDATHEVQPTLGEDEDQSFNYGQDTLGRPSSSPPPRTLSHPPPPPEAMVFSHHSLLGTPMYKTTSPSGSGPYDGTDLSQCDDPFFPHHRPSGKRKRSYSDTPAMGPSGTIPIIANVIDASLEASDVRAWVTRHLKHSACSDCGLEQVETEQDILQLHNSLERSGCLITYHCATGRLVKIFLILAHFDATSKHNKPTRMVGKEPLSPPRQKRRDRRQLTIPKGLGYAPKEWDSGLYGGEGTAADLNEQRYDERYVKETVAAALSENDEMTCKAMNALVSLLPSGEDDNNGFDSIPPLELLSLVSRSSILDRSAELLQSSSIEDVKSKGALFDALTTLLIKLASHKIANTLIFNRRSINRAGHNVLKVAISQPTRLADDQADTALSLASCADRLAKQGSILLGSSHFNADNDASLYTFRNINELARLIESNAPAAAAVNARTEPSLLDIPYDKLLQNHAFVNLIENKLGQSAIMPLGRMPRILQEIAVLTEALPPGIFVRYATERPDVMKILIVGPRDTPYENGLFEFDLLCPEAFPNVPPQMRFRTTHGGRYGFNPNLYVDGYVCLSVLNTWGENDWRPKESTILQILLSIQAMIFTSQPYCNEPGHEPGWDSHASMGYNRALYPMTIRAAMLGWLEAPEGVNGVWDNVIQEHFTTNSVRILATVDKWIADVKAMPQPLLQWAPYTGSLFQEEEKTLWASETIRGKEDVSGNDKEKQDLSLSRFISKLQTACEEL